MILSLIIGIVIFYLVSVLVLSRAVQTAADGYEDESGFHAGQPPAELGYSQPGVRSASGWDLGPVNDRRWVESPTAVAEELVLHH